jgi:hypothetical protein
MVHNKFSIIGVQYSTPDCIGDQRSQDYHRTDEAECVDVRIQYKVIEHQAEHYLTVGDELQLGHVS